ncbi:hypothetical protein NHJ13734_009306 [Beauveria thailandica]
MEIPSTIPLSPVALLTLIFKVLVLLPLYSTIHIAHMAPVAILTRMDIRYSVICAVVKAAFTVLDPREVQAVVPSTRTAYWQWISKQARRQRKSRKPQVLPDVQTLEAVKDSAILWLGDRRIAKKIVLYVHGGGYVIPMLPGHLDFCWKAFIETGAETGVAVAVGLVQYTLVPGGRMPTQLRQVVAAFNEVRSQGFAPRDIIIGGESGGANLTMQFIGHLLHAHPEVPAVALAEPLAGVLAISPALGSNAETRSFRENKNCDMITEALVRGLAGDMLPKGEAENLDLIDNPWARPLDSDPSFYSGLSQVSKNVYFMVGDRELLADHSRIMAALLRKHAPDVLVNLEETTGQPHSGILLEAIIGNVGESTLNVMKWYKTIVGDH